MKTKNRAQIIRQIVMTAALVIAACAILFGKQLALNVLAASAGKVTSTTANVRASASTSSEAIASLSKGDTIEIRSQTNGTDGYVWYEITVDATRTGYIRSDLVEITDGTTPAGGNAGTTATTTTTPTANSDGVTVVETVSGTTTADVNVRADASTNSEIVAKAASGLTLSVTGTKQGTDGNTWYYLTFTKDGVSTTGYIRSDFVNLSGELKEPSANAEPDPVPATTEVAPVTVQKRWETQEQADGWFLLDYEQGQQWNIDNLFQTNETNTQLLQKQEAKIKSLRTGLIIVIIILIAVIAAAVFFFMKWKDLDDRAAFAEAEKERAKRIAGHGDGRRPASDRVQRTSRDREAVRREGGEQRRRPAEGAARTSEGRTGERPVRPASAGERRPVDVQRGQSSHTVRPSEPQERRAEAPAREAAPVREAAPQESRAAAAEPEAERRTHRPRPQADAPVKEHHRKPPVDDDDDEFEFGFLNWDDDDK